MNKFTTINENTFGENIVLISVILAYIWFTKKLYSPLLSFEESNTIITSLIPALAGALGGAWAAQKIADKNREKKN